MKTYAAFLRGINVGGKHRVHMEQLAHAMEETGFFRVRTFIQSGNVLFDTDMGDQALKPQIEQALAVRFGFFIPAVIRTPQELCGIIANCPYTQAQIETANENSGTEGLHICLLENPLTSDGAASLQAFSSGGDRFEIRDTNIYLLLENGVHHSKLIKKLMALFPGATMRNFKTISHLAKMATEES